MTENEKNIERGKKWGMTPYNGQFNEIYLDGEWYCPDCSGKTKLKLNRYGDGLYCPEHPELCEYEYHNAAGRDKHRVFWAVGFEYPLSKVALIMRQRVSLLAELDKNRERQASLRQRNRAIEHEVQCIDVELYGGE